MSDATDLLDIGGGSQTKTKQTVQVDYSSIMDRMKTELSVEKDPAKRQKILEATLQSVGESAVKDKDDMLSAIKALTDFQDSIGAQFEGFLNLNEEEVAIIEKAEAALTSAKAAKQAALEVPNTWWQRLWGREGRITRTTNELKAAEKALTDAQAEAKQMHRTRMEKAGMQELLEEYALRSRKMCEQLAEREMEIKEVEEKLLVQSAEANRIHAEALKLKEKTEADLATAKQKMEQEHEALAGIADKQSVEYAKQFEIVQKAEQSVETLQGKLNSAVALAASKDSFLHKHNLAMKTLTSLRANLNTHRAKLKSDTDERVRFYEAYLMSLKAKNDQELVSILEKLGVKQDEAAANTMAQIYTASSKARQEMMKNIPIHEKNMAEVYGHLAESMKRIRTEDQLILKDFDQRFGIDVSKFFEESYGEGSTTPSGDGAEKDNGGTNSTQGKTAEELIG